MVKSIGAPTLGSPTMQGMEKWAERILRKMESTPGLDKAGLARACGIKPPSVFQWFSDTDSKPATRMIAGDNLVAAARYLGMTADEIMTGAQSQPARLDADRLAMLIEAVESAAEGVWKGEARSRALLVAALYMDGQVTPETAAVAARAALNGILSTHRGMRESTVKG